MKSRRLTIFCVAMIALAGTPRAWQEVGKLLNIVQHKAQVKFWSMVLPGDRESAKTELIAAVQLSESEFADVASTCPTSNGESWKNRAPGSSKANHVIARASVQTKARAQRQTDGAPASHAGLIAKAIKAPRVDESVESLLRSRKMWESLPSAVALNAPTPLVIPNAATLPPQPASTSDTFRYVLIPPAYPVAASLVEKEAVLHFKLMKKSIEDRKLLRQKRLPVSNGFTAFPSS
jgi:hypothetical protein